jgi:hypothetical protein
MSLILCSANSDYKRFGCKNNMEEGDGVTVENGDLIHSIMQGYIFSNAWAQFLTQIWIRFI